MTCTHHWTVTSECPAYLRDEIERLAARVRELQAERSEWEAEVGRRASVWQERAERAEMSDDMTLAVPPDPDGSVTLPPFGHAFVLPELTLAAVRERCYIVERETFDRLQERAERAEADRDALRALLREARECVASRTKFMAGYPVPKHLQITPERADLAARIDAALAGKKP